MIDDLLRQDIKILWKNNRDFLISVIWLLFYISIFVVIYLRAGYYREQQCIKETGNKCIPQVGSSIEDGGGVPYENLPDW